MESTLLRLNRHWSENKYTSIHKRSLFEQLKNKKNLPHIQVLTGIRRSGKSTIFQLLINDLMDEGVNPKAILLLNLDEPLFTPFWDNAAGLYSIIEISEKLTGVKIKYLFLDEIQHVTNWELFAKGAYDTKQFSKIYITGSNSNLLQNKFATLLSGRYFANMVRPFSLNELFLLNGITDKLTAVSRKPELLRVVDKYIEWGSFPEIVLNETTDFVKTELLQNYYESIVLKDCISYNQVRETNLFYRLMYFVLSNVGTPFYYSGLGKAVKSNENTARKYLDFATQSYVISDITNFSYSLKEDLRPQHKAYCIDNGLMNSVGFRFSPKNGILLENSVYNELVNNGYDMISFARKTGECDFIARKNNEYHAFQVCYELSLQNKSREILGFKALGGDVEFASKTLITYNQEDSYNDIRIVPFWQLFGGF